eukprot:1179481-Prorocentrum_minimum.AAC.1
MEAPSLVSAIRPSVGCGARANSSRAASSSGLYHAPLKRNSAHSLGLEGKTVKLFGTAGTSGSDIPVSSRSTSVCRLWRHDARGILHASHVSSHTSQLCLKGSPFSCGLVGDSVISNNCKNRPSLRRAWHTTSAQWTGDSRQISQPGAYTRQSANDFSANGSFDTLKGVVKRLTFHSEVREDR